MRVKQEQIWLIICRRYMLRHHTTMNRTNDHDPTSFFYIGNSHSWELSESIENKWEKRWGKFLSLLLGYGSGRPVKIQQNACSRRTWPNPDRSRPRRSGSGGEALQPGIVSCHILLICQCSGLFLERPELAARNRTAINLGWEWSGGPSRMDSWDADVFEPVPEQVMKQWSDSTRYSI